jgi:hypothetical protein
LGLSSAAQSDFLAGLNSLESQSTINAPHRNHQQRLRVLHSRSNTLPMKLITLLGCMLLAIAGQTGAQIINGDFENGFDGWNYNDGVYIIGQPGFQPIGIGGTYAADLGGAEITGSELWQTVQVIPQAHYRLDFFSASNGDHDVGDVAIGKVRVEDNAGRVIASNTITNISQGVMMGDQGFVAQSLEFKAPKDSDRITIRFLDQTPNGGINIDWVVDKVSLTQLSRFGQRREQ